MNKKTIYGIDYETNDPIHITIQGGIITGIKKQSSKQKGNIPYIAPGLVDLQINGYKGLSFNTPAIKIKDIITITKALWTVGVTTYYPTVVTNSSDNISSIVKTIAEACHKEPFIEQCIGGIHLEGPFISLEDGPRGAHIKKFIQAPDYALFEKWQKAANGSIKIITLSPEWSNVNDFIKKIIKKGVIASIGHTAATPEQIQQAVKAGARMSTHLGNGSHLVLSRHPNYIWEQLAQNKLSACIIVDGFHLPDSVIKTILKVKERKLFLISDSTRFSEMKPGEYSSHIGGDVVLTKEGRLYLAENPNLLAGSAQTLLWGITYLTDKRLCKISQAWNMASVYPSKFMKLSSAGGIQVGAPADIVVFKYDKQHIEVSQTFKNGQLVYQKN